RRAGTSVAGSNSTLGRTVVIVLLGLLAALLGAIFASRLWGPSQAASNLHIMDTQIVMSASLDGQPQDGMIGRRPAGHDGPRTAPQTTTARNQ
ncbi:MAG TPA: hypothetical protein VGK35_03870, partial [Actinotalea sp.]